MWYAQSQQQPGDILRAGIGMGQKHWSTIQQLLTIGTHDGMGLSIPDTNLIKPLND